MSWQTILWHSTVSCEKFPELWSPSPGIQGPCSWGLFWGSSVASSLSHGSGQNPFSCLLHSMLLCPLSCGCSSVLASRLELLPSLLNGRIERTSSLTVTNPISVLSWESSGLTLPLTDSLMIQVAYEPSSESLLFC